MSIIITTYVKLFKMDCQKHDISCNIGPGGVKHAQGIGKPWMWHVEDNLAFRLAFVTPQVFDCPNNGNNVVTT